MHTQIFNNIYKHRETEKKRQTASYKWNVKGIQTEATAKRQETLRRKSSTSFSVYVKICRIPMQRSHISYSMGLSLSRWVWFVKHSAFDRYLCVCACMCAMWTRAIDCDVSGKKFWQMVQFKKSLNFGLKNQNDSFCANKISKRRRTKKQNKNKNCNEHWKRVEREI